MKISINGTNTLESVQKQFNLGFPFLKIEFFTEPHSKGKPTSGKLMLSSKKQIRECTKANVDVVLDVEKDLTVFELEELFEDSFGLHIQVFRKSGRIWLETTATDDWTLHYQNEEGKELSEGANQKDDLPDYHEQE